MSLTVVFTGGGTGGHIYPGLAIADEFRRLCSENGKDCKIVWIGSSSGMDKKIVEKSGSVDKFYGIPAGKLRRYFSFKNFIDVFKIFAGFIAAFFILCKIKPSIVFSKGGFVSVPPCFAAKLLKIAVFTHECDFSPGLATKLNSKFAKRILLSYEQTSNFFSENNKKKLIVTGNPVRPVFYNANSDEGKKFLGLTINNEKPILVVVGGSLGAKQINQFVLENLDFLCENFVVVHQTGADGFSLFANVSKENYKVYPFIYNEMPNVLAAADVVLSRAGANSIWECAVLGKPMVLVPLCGSGTRGDQLENAKFFEQKGAAVVLAGENATNENLICALEQMKKSENRLLASNAAKQMTCGKFPAEDIANLIYSEVFL